MRDGRLPCRRVTFRYPFQPDELPGTFKVTEVGANRPLPRGYSASADRSIATIAPGSVGRSLGAASVVVPLLVVASNCVSPVALSNRSHVAWYAVGALAMS